MTDWPARAACDTEVADLFDDHTGEPDDETPYERGRRHGQAIAICNRCPVHTLCLDDALPGDGIRGGQLFEAIDIDMPIPYLPTERL